VKAISPDMQNRIMKLGSEAYALSKQAAKAGTDMMNLQAEFDSAIT
jgi:hypothetical protein